MRPGRGGRAAAVIAPALTALSVVVVCAASAFACTNLATMTLSSSAGRPGDTIVLTGTSFPVPRANSAAQPTPVVIRWKASDGPIIGTVMPDRTGTISLTFTVPPSDPGNVVIVGVQKRPVLNPDLPDAQPTAFVDEPGTPARATFRVLAAGESPPHSMVTADFVTAPGDSGTTAMIVLMVLFGAVAMSLFAGGVIAFLHQVRSHRLAPQRWPNWERLDY